MLASTLLRRTYCLNEDTKKISLYLDDNPRPEMRIEAPSGRALLNDTNWFVLVTFKFNIPKRVVHELRHYRHTLSVHYGRYIRITSENTQVF